MIFSIEIMLFDFYTKILRSDVYIGSDVRCRLGVRFSTSWKIQNYKINSYILLGIEFMLFDFHTKILISLVFHIGSDVGSVPMSDVDWVLDFPGHGKLKIIRSNFICSWTSELCY